MINQKLDIGYVVDEEPNWSIPIAYVGECLDYEYHPASTSNCHFCYFKKLYLVVNK